MATYLVLKRMTIGVVKVPARKLVQLDDPEQAFKLIELGHLLPVPDNYPGDVVRLSRAVASPPASRSGGEDTATDSPPAIRPVARAKTK